MATGITFHLKRLFPKRRGLLKRRWNLIPNWLKPTRHWVSFITNTNGFLKKRTVNSVRLFA